MLVLPLLDLKALTVDLEGNRCSVIAEQKQGAVHEIVDHVLEDRHVGLVI
jgi:hypothetical protein